MMRKVRRYNVSLKAGIAECLATALFVYIGCGAATTFSSRSSSELAFTRSPVNITSDVQEALVAINSRFQINSSWGVTTALAFGLAITVLAYATAHLSGGQLNPAVTAALAAVGALPLPQAALNICAQIVGAIIGAGFLAVTIPDSQRYTLGSNEIVNGVGYGNALCGEIIMTFVLVSVVLETAVNKKSVARAQAPLAIGFAVFCAHAVLLPIDGCSINPARSLGPAIISSTWPSTFWVFVVGPFLGALVAVPFHLLFRSDWDTVPMDQGGEDPVDLRAADTFRNNPDIVAQASKAVQQAQDEHAMAAGGGLVADKSVHALAV